MLIRRLITLQRLDRIKSWVAACIISCLTILYQLVSPTYDLIDSGYIRVAAESVWLNSGYFCLSRLFDSHPAMTRSLYVIRIHDRWKAMAHGYELNRQSERHCGRTNRPDPSTYLKFTRQESRITWMSSYISHVQVDLLINIPMKQRKKDRKFSLRKRGVGGEAGHRTL